MAFLLHIIILIALHMFVPLGYNLVFGKGKVLHFGQLAQGITAAYVLWVLVMQFQWNFLSAFLLAAAATTAISLLLAWLSLRLEPDGFGVLSIAFHLIALAVVLNWQTVTRGALGIPQIPRWPFLQSNEMFAIAVVSAALLWVFFIWMVDRSTFGRELEALAEHEWLAASIGISRTSIHTIAFLIAGLGSFIANIFFPMYLFLLSPADYNFSALIFIVMSIVAGGPGHLWGVALATTSLVLLREALRFVPLAPSTLGPGRLMLFGLILFVAVWFRRDTLFPRQRMI